jgi:hypothetical protein
MRPFAIAVPASIGSAVASDKILIAKSKLQFMREQLENASNECCNRACDNCENAERDRTCLISADAVSGRV